METSLMLIHEFLAADDKARTSVKHAHASRAPRSPARLAAEATWCAIWHTAMALERGSRWMALAARIRRERQTLLTLDDNQLDDIGLTRDQAVCEATRHWSDLPAGR